MPADISIPARRGKSGVEVGPCLMRLWHADMRGRVGGASRNQTLWVILYKHLHCYHKAGTWNCSDTPVLVRGWGWVRPLGIKLSAVLPWAGSFCVYRVPKNLWGTSWNLCYVPKRTVLTKSSSDTKITTMSHCTGGLALDIGELSNGAIRFCTFVKVCKHTSLRFKHWAFLVEDMQIICRAVICKMGTWP